MKLRLIVFCLSLALCAFIAWLTGYNFDERSPTVAYFTGLAISLSAVAALVT